MANSNSHLLNYISKLMEDDEALAHFLADPITNSEKAGLSKAERSVLRRVVASLSNNALNGYSIVRDLSSYRRSIRLLQNVLRHVGAKMLQDHHSNNQTSQPQLIRGNEDNTIYQFTMEIYFPDYNGGYYYEKTNNDINAYAYATTVVPVPLSIANPTVKDVMDQVKNVILPGQFDFEYTADAAGNNSVSNLILAGTPYIVDLNNPDYQEQYNPANQNPYNSEGRYAFWFYSINGKAGQVNTGANYAPYPTPYETKFFDSYQLSPNDHLIWQLIAPDPLYGFQSCAPGSNNAHAVKKKAATAE